MVRTAKIRVLDGNAAGCHECTVEGWMGVAFRIPRALLPDGKARKKYEDACSELTQSGVYFLFGKTEKGEKSVYVGKAERRIDPRTNETNGVLFRVMQRHSNKKDPTIADRWEETVMIVSDNDKRIPMKHYIDFLENKFYRLAKNSEEAAPHAYKVLNNSVPQRGDHTPDVERNFSGFVECANTALIALGHYVLEPLPQDKRKVPVDPIPAPELPNPSTPHKDGLLLSLSYTPKALGKTFIASGKYISDNEFVVLEGSEFCPVEIPCCRGKVKRVRRDHADKIKNGKLTSDVQFENPSIAAGFVCGSPMDGYRNWRDPNPKSKKTLGEILAESKKD